MNVEPSPELEGRLASLAMESGRSADELVRDAIADLVDELAETRATLDRRFDEIRNGEVQLIPGEEVFARLREKSEALRRR
jgi:predicted transcriptional regulator